MVSITFMVRLMLSLLYFRTFAFYTLLFDNFRLSLSGKSSELVLSTC